MILQKGQFKQKLQEGGVLPSKVEAYPKRQASCTRMLDSTSQFLVQPFFLTQ